MAPASETELAEAVAGAAGPLAVRGGGTRGFGAPAGEALSVAGLSGVELYEPGALTIVARAGTPVAEVEAVLAAEGQRLPFEPMDHRTLSGANGAPTVGGMVAANVSGPRRIQAGACRDSLIGVRFVDGSGTIVKSGGRVMKNVTGYDLVKLMAGSFGTLGILSEVAFKVLPATEASATLVLDGVTPERGVAALSAALGSPFEVSGAAHLTADQQAVMRLEGFEDQVGYRSERLAAVLASFGEVRVERDAARSARIWADVRDATGLAAEPGDIWRLSVRPTDGPVVWAALGRPPALFDWGGGLIWVRVADGTDVRAGLAGVAGHATLVRATPATRARLGTFHPEPPALAALAQGLRRQYDPRGILNAGLMSAEA
ncbi:MAG: FAD-binding protein [Pseudomonadota bacterium]